MESLRSGRLKWTRDFLPLLADRRPGARQPLWNYHGRAGVQLLFGDIDSAGGNGWGDGVSLPRRPLVGAATAYARPTPSRRGGDRRRRGGRFPLFFFSPGLFLGFFVAPPGG